MDRETIYEVRQCDAREADAFLARDVAALATLWHPSFIVNAPNSMVMTGADTLALIASGKLYHLRLTRSVETARLFGDTALLMGEESVEDDWGPFAGQLVRRRFTNIWRMAGGQWLLVARHANLHPGDIAARAA